MHADGVVVEGRAVPDQQLGVGVRRRVVESEQAFQDPGHVELQGFLRDGMMVMTMACVFSGSGCERRAHVRGVDLLEGFTLTRAAKRELALGARFGRWRFSVGRGWRVG